jgi:hypothetical protein
MRKLLKRWYVWLGLVLLLGLAASVASVAVVCSSRLTKTNFDLIQEGMTEEQVTAIVGPANHRWTGPGLAGGDVVTLHWRTGPNVIIVRFADARVETKSGHVLSTFETLQWYAKEGAAKIGINWD